MERPFFALAKSVGVEGAFQRVESVVAALWTFSDLAIAGLLCFAMRAQWREIGPAGTERKGGAVLLLLAALLADGVLAGGVYALYTYEPGVMTVITWQVMAVTGGSVFLFGLLITLLCAWVAVNKFLRMKAGDLYKI